MPDMYKNHFENGLNSYHNLARISHKKSAAKPGSTVSTSLQSQKHSRHTDSMPASAFVFVPCIHSTPQLFATILVRNAG